MADATRRNRPAIAGRNVARLVDPPPRSRISRAGSEISWATRRPQRSPRVRFQETSPTTTSPAHAAAAAPSAVQATTCNAGIPMNHPPGLALMPHRPGAREGGEEPRRWRLYGVPVTPPARQDIWAQAAAILCPMNLQRPQAEQPSGANAVGGNSFGPMVEQELRRFLTSTRHRIAADAPDA